MNDPTGSTAARVVLTAVDGVGRGEGEDGGVLGVSAFTAWCQERDRHLTALTRARVRWGTASLHR